MFEPKNTSGTPQSAPAVNAANTDRRGVGAMGLMRRTDHWLGLPICWFLGVLVTIIRKILPARKRTISGTGTIAVFKFFGIGSILESTPLLRAIRQRYPQSRLAFVTFSGNEGLLRKLNLCTDLRIIRTSSPWAFVSDVLKQLWWMRTHHVEAVVDLEFFSKFSTLLSFFTYAPIRVGFYLNDFWRYSLLTHPIYFNYYSHIADVYAQAGERLDAPLTDHSLSYVEPIPEVRQSLEAKLRERGWSADKPLLGVNVNAGELSYERRWPLGYFAQVVQQLLEKHVDLYVVLPGSPGERTYVQGLVDQLPPALQTRTILAAGAWSLDEFSAALTLFRGMVTNDSGPLHLAAAQGCPIVSIWGPSMPSFYSPRVQNNQVIYAKYPCSPCVCMFTTFEGMWCNHQAWCMQAIEPATVLAATEKMLLTSAPGN